MTTEPIRASVTDLIENLLERVAHLEARMGILERAGHFKADAMEKEVAAIQRVDARLMLLEQKLQAEAALVIDYGPGDDLDAPVNT